MNTHTLTTTSFRALCFRCLFAAPAVDAAAAAAADVITLMPMDFSFPLVRFSLIFICFFFFSDYDGKVMVMMIKRWNEYDRVKWAPALFEAANSSVFIMDYCVVKRKTGNICNACGLYNVHMQSPQWILLWVAQTGPQSITICTCHIIHSTIYRVTSSNDTQLFIHIRYTLYILSSEHWTHSWQMT